jgi:hypothetical protein
VHHSVKRAHGGNIDLCHEQLVYKDKEIKKLMAVLKEKDEELKCCNKHMAHLEACAAHDQLKLHQLCLREGCIQLRMLGLAVCFKHNNVFLHVALPKPALHHLFVDLTHD